MSGRWLRAAALVLGAVLAAVPARAQQAPAAPPPLIVTLDEDRLFRDSLFGKAVLARQEADAQALAAEFREIETALEAEERSLTEQRATMTRETFQPLADAFNTRVEGIRRAQDAKSRALNRQFDEERQRFFQAARPVLLRLMQERGAMAIIDKRAVFIGFDELDITAVAVAALDRDLGDGGPPPRTDGPEPAPTTP